MRKLPSTNKPAVYGTLTIEAGGDDFLPKSLSEGVLRAKMKALVRIVEMRGQLQQSEKMATIGRLAAGVAHEINNPVGYSILI